MSKILNAALLAGAFVAAAGSASALTITSIEGDCAGDSSLSGCSSDASRLDLGNIGLNEDADGSFYSLGIGRTATIFFDRKVTGQLSASEVTFNRDTYIHETAEVYGGIDTGNGFDFSTLLGSLSNRDGGDGVSTLSFSGSYAALRFVDTTDVGNDTRTADGYDLDSLTVASVPLPASALLLLGSLGGLGALRRRKG